MAFIETQYSFGISTKSNELRLYEKKFEVVEGIKFVRKAKKKALGKSSLIAKFKIIVPFEIQKVNRSRSYLGNGLQHDDIHCSEEWSELVKVYDKEMFSKFIVDCFKEIGVTYNGNTNQII